MISAINGPALRLSFLPLLCDIVLAAEEAAFQDSGISPEGWPGRRDAHYLPIANGHEPG